MRLVAAVLTMLCAAQPALALSCMRPDAARDFNQAQASEDVWVIVEGRLTFDSKALPDKDLSKQNAAPVPDIPARIKGRSLGPDGFTRPFTQDITLRVLCFGPWCGSAQNNTKYIAFLKRENGGYVMPVGPCGSRVYPKPSAAVRKTLAQCFAGGACQEAGRKR